MCILDKGNGRRINSRAAIIPCARREARRTNIHDDSSMETGGGFFWGGALQPVGKNSQRFPGAEDSNRHSSGAGVGAYSPRASRRGRCSTTAASRCVQTAGIQSSQSSTNQRYILDWFDYSVFARRSRAEQHFSFLSRHPSLIQVYACCQMQFESN
jgi:hypothetical protein